MTSHGRPGNRAHTEPKLTKGSRRVLDALEKSHQLSSAQDIYGVLRSSQTESPGLTTVYRSLESLVALGLVQAVDLGDGEKRYEAVSPGEHHHHLICESCQKSIHLDQCLVEDLEKSIRSKYGFTIHSHVLEVFGSCRDCLKAGCGKD